MSRYAERELSARTHAKNRTGYTLWRKDGAPVSHDDLMLARSGRPCDDAGLARGVRASTPKLTPVTDADRAVESDVRQTPGCDRPGGASWAEFGG